MGGNPEEDITTSPSLYKNFAGKPLRIQVFWTVKIREQGGALSQSLEMIKTAQTILKKYTLDLDWVPQPTGAEFPAGVNFDQTLFVPGTTTNLGNARSGYATLRDKLTLPPDDRLLVVFTPLNGAGGICVRDPKWLPWVLVDSSQFSNKNASTLMHEIGHASRLGHQQMDVPAQPTQADSDKFRNVMGPKDTGDQLWNWQAEAFLNSAWCAGGAPKDWWVIDKCLQAVDCAFLW